MENIATSRRGTNMSGITLEEDSIDEILYLARVNEASELSSYLSELAAQTKRSNAEIVAAAVDPYSNNGALHYAGANGHLDVIKLLLSHDTGKAPVSASGITNAVNDAGNTALHWAALNGHLECVKFLVEAGADVTIINKAGHDAVFEAEINDKKEVVEWLLGAVEALEKGIGQAAGASADGGNEGAQGMGREKDNNTPDGVGGSDTADVEDARRQMEVLQTQDKSSQGG